MKCHDWPVPRTVNTVNYAIDLLDEKRKREKKKLGILELMMWRGLTVD